MNRWDDRIISWKPADTAPVAAKNQDGSIELYWGVKQDNVQHKILHCWQKDFTDPTSWTSPVILTGAVGAPRAAETDATNRINLFWSTYLAELCIWIQARQNEHNNMFQTYFEPFSEPFHPGTRVAHMDIGKNADGRLEPIYQGANGHLYHIWQKDDKEHWSEETRIGDDVQAINVALDESNELNAFVKGSNDQDVIGSEFSHLYCRRRSSGNWGENIQIARDVSDFAVTRADDGHLVVFFTTRYSNGFTGIFMIERYAGTRQWTTPDLFSECPLTPLWVITDVQGRVVLFWRGQKNQLLCRALFDPYEGVEVVDVSAATSGELNEIEGVKAINFHDGRIGVFLLASSENTKSILLKWTKQ